MLILRLIILFLLFHSINGNKNKEAIQLLTKKISGFEKEEEINMKMKEIKKSKDLKNDLKYCVWLMILCNDYTIDTFVRSEHCHKYYSFESEKLSLPPKHNEVTEQHTCWKYIKNYNVNMDDLYVVR
uniref:Uncharacterized protein n=1 Tax=Strongyloides papillosus TaxID=174720 RepID=A0A0N5BX06_STREA